MKLSDFVNIMPKRAQVERQERNVFGHLPCAFSSRPSASTPTSASATSISLSRQSGDIFFQIDLKERIRLTLNHSTPGFIHLPPYSGCTTDGSDSFPRPSGPPLPGFTWEETFAKAIPPPRTDAPPRQPASSASERRAEREAAIKTRESLIAAAAVYHASQAVPFPIPSSSVASAFAPLPAHEPSEPCWDPPTFRKKKDAVAFPGAALHGDIFHFQHKWVAPHLRHLHVPAQKQPKLPKPPKEKKAKLTKAEKKARKRERERMDEEEMRREQAVKPLPPHIAADKGRWDGLPMAGPPLHFR
ncbi:hypothetical protein JCM8547_001004 [Rhodosporidiobolus lusitaniae]